MLRAELDNQIVIAEFCEKGHNYICPECKQPVTLRKCKKKLSHFAHKKGSNCPLAKKRKRPENADEAAKKIEPSENTDNPVANYFKSRGYHGFIGTTKSDNRATTITVYNLVTDTIGNKRDVVFLLQNPYMSINEIASITKKYKEENSLICWLLDSNRLKEMIQHRIFTMTEQERYLKGLHFGIFVGVVDGELKAFKPYDVKENGSVQPNNEKYIRYLKVLQPSEDLIIRNLKGATYGYTSYPDRLYVCVSFPVGQKMPTGTYDKVSGEVIDRLPA